MLWEHKKVVAKCHRRYGKGTTALVYVFERCITEKIIVRYGAPTQKQAYQIIDLLIDHIYHYSPKCKPQYLKGRYVFESGSEIYVFGCKDEGEADKARGTEAHIIYCDEYAFWRYKPRYILDSVLSPQLDTTDGQLIITSTPPDDLTHPYMEEMAYAEAKGYLFEWDILDSIKIGDVSHETHKKIIERCKGVETDAYKREYLCLNVADRSRLVIPEAQNEGSYVGSIERPAYYESYVCMDLGLRDHTAALFGYLDFPNARLVIEKEYVTNYKSTSEIVEKCKEIEENLGIIDNIYRRIGDCEMQQLFDMSRDHDYSITPITKRTRQSNQGFRDSVINQLRIGIANNKVLINKEECPLLCMQLKYGIWNEKRTDFERTTKMGHLDALMALAYLFDNISWDRNPFPILPYGTKESTHFIREDMVRKVRDTNSIKKMLGISK